MTRRLKTPPRTAYTPAQSIPTAKRTTRTQHANAANGRTVDASATKSHWRRKLAAIRDTIRAIERALRHFRRAEAHAAIALQLAPRDPTTTTTPRRRADTTRNLDLN